jgi:hypothetical protein
MGGNEMKAIVYKSCEGLNPVYCKYDGQTNPQGAYIEIDPENGTVEADYDGEIGDSVSEAVYNGRIKQVSISPYMTG